jgi:hypothetical protein
MELAVAGILGLAGYWFSKDPSQQPQALHQAPKQPEQKKTDDTIVSRGKAMEEAKAQDRYQAAQDPHESGIIHDSRVYPFFRSARTQNYNENIVSRKHDLFVGNESTWMKKKESAPRFKPIPQQITSSGTQGNPVCNTRRLPVASMYHNNVRPNEQIRVGPGLNSDKLVDMREGFHPRTRILPENVNVYRKNQLQARLQHGKGTEMRPVDPIVRNNAPPRVWSMNRRPLEKGRASVTAQTQRPDVQPECVNRVHDSVFGHAFKSSGHATDPEQMNTRVRDDNNRGFDQTNVTSATTSAAGGYSVSHYDNSKFSSQNREQGSSVPSAVRGSTLRHLAPSGYVTSARTLREVGNGEYMGGAGHYNAHGYVRTPGDESRTTLRELVADKNQLGPGKASVHAPMQQCTFKQLGKPAKRPVVDGYFSGVERNAQFRQAMNVSESTCVGTMYRNDERRLHEENRVLGHPNSQAMYNNMAKIGKSGNSHNKLPVVNMRQDFGMIGQQLQNNPYAIK